MSQDHRATTRQHGPHSHGPAREPNARRHFLRGAGLAAASAAAWPLMPLQALAQSTGGSGYRALVCIFLFGGNDANNMIVPLDARYATYLRGRPNLALDRASLVPLGAAGSSGYGAHPAMAALKPLFDGGQAAVVANVGPLMVPTTLAQVRARSVPLPANLYSHSDQQNSWQSSISEGAGRSGWGGRLLERSVAEGSANRGYSAISVAGGNLWEGGDRGLAPYRVSPSGRLGFDFFNPAGTDPLSRAVASLLTETRADPLQQTWLNMVGRSMDNQRVLSTALGSTSLATVFPSTGLGDQLKMAARLISARAALGLQRQCFFASIGGFDTHGDDQLSRQNELLGELAGAMAAFHQATVELGVADQVTQFTASDFGRTFASNGQGTDHGWGAHQWVVGGGVRGGRVVGRFPDLTLGGPDDVGSGVWVPGLSVDQLGGELARWYGASPALVDEVFPRLRHFDRSLGLMV